MTRTLVLAALALAGCGDAGSSGVSSESAITSVSGTTAGSSSGGDCSSTGPAEDSGADSGSSSAGLLQDVGTDMDFGSGQPRGCQGKVDLLFVISRSGTMKTEQTQLWASFADFIDTIEQKLEGFDFHIMVANPDAYWPGWTCEQGACQDPMLYPHCGPSAMEYQCGIYPDLITPCDEQLGAGLIFNAGADASNKICELYDGHRYIVSGQPELEDALGCIAKVGYAGDDPLLGDAMIAALSPGLNGPDGCNEGFLREDALLVVTFISDDWDESKSFAYQQFAAIAAAKEDPSTVVMLAVVPQPLGDREPEPGCSYDEGSLTFEELMAKFPYSVYGDTCSSSFGPFFDKAAAKISEACGAFIPQ